MRKIFLCAAALFCALSLGAQNKSDILSKIAKAPVRSEAVTGRFTEVRTPMSKEAAKVTLKGKLVFKTEGFLSMLYDNKEQFTIDGDKMVVDRDGTVMVYNLTKNLMMKGLSEILLCSFRGTLEDLAKVQDADIEARVEGSRYVVTLTPRKKTPRGCSKLVVSYDKASCAIKDMRIDEMTGASTFYSMD